MSTDIRFGTQAIVQNESGELLLILREDFNVWTFPGGSLDANETLKSGAIREAKEETGIDIELTGIHMIYTSDNGRSYGVVFTGKPVGGNITRSFESVDVQYFKPADIPENQVPWLGEVLAGYLQQNHNQLYERKFPFSLWLKIKIGVFLRDLRNRYLLRQPTPDPTYFRLTVYGLFDGECIAEINAIRGQVAWQSLLRVANSKSAQKYAIHNLGSIRMDVENHHAYMTVNLERI